MVLTVRTYRYRTRLSTESKVLLSPDQVLLKGTDQVTVPIQAYNKESNTCFLRPVETNQKIKVTFYISGLSLIYNNSNNIIIIIIMDDTCLAAWPFKF